MELPVTLKIPKSDYLGVMNLKMEAGCIRNTDCKRWFSHCSLGTSTSGGVEATVITVTPDVESERIRKPAVQVTFTSICKEPEWGTDHSSSGESESFRRWMIWKGCDTPEATTNYTYYRKRSPTASLEYAAPYTWSIFAILELSASVLGPGALHLPQLVERVTSLKVSNYLDSDR